MLTTAFHNANEDHLLSPKRMIGFATNADEKKLSEELGLEKEKDLHPGDSQAEIMELIKAVYTIDDVDDFSDKFGDTLQELGIINDTQRLPDAIMVEDTTSGELIVEPRIRDDLVRKLMAKFTERASEKGQRAIEKLPLYSGSEEVTAIAQQELLRLKGTATAASDAARKGEANYYQMLANTVGSLGIKKTELSRTNELTERKQLLEQSLKSTGDQLGQLKNYRDNLDQFETESKEKAKSWKSWIARHTPVVLAAVTAGFLTFGALSGPAGWATVGSIAWITGVGAGTGAAVKGLEWKGFLDKGILSGTDRGKERASIAVQNELLGTGRVKLVSGQSLLKFRIPANPNIVADDGSVSPFDNSFSIEKGGTIDGRPVETDTDVAQPGQVVTGKVVEGKEIRTETPEKEVLEARLEEEQEAFDLVNKELTLHNQLMGNKKKSFEDQYTVLEKKIEENEKSLGKATQHLASLQTRGIMFPGRGTLLQQKELDSTKKAFNAAKGELKRYKEALDAMKKVKRIFELNDDFAKIPVPQGMIDALYGERLNPQLTKVIKELAAEQDNQTTEAQKKLGSVSAKQLAGLLKGMEKAERADLIKQIIEPEVGFLARVSAGVDSNPVWGKKSPYELKRLYPLLGKLESSNKKLFDILIAVPSLTLKSRYALGTEAARNASPLEDITDDLRRKFGEVERIIVAEEAAKKPAKAASLRAGRGLGRGRRGPGGDEGDKNDDEEDENDKSREKPRRGRKAPREPLSGGEARDFLDGLDTLLKPGECPEHLDGLQEILNSNPSTVQQLFHAACSAQELDDSLRVPRDFKPGGDFTEYLDQLWADGNQAEFARWMDRIAYIKEDAVVLRIKNDGRIEENKSARKLERKTALRSSVTKKTTQFVSKCNSFIRLQGSTTPHNSPKVALDNISTIALRTDNLLKGGAANDGCLDVELNDEFFQDAENASKLEALEYNLKLILNFFASGFMSVVFNNNRTYGVLLKNEKVEEFGDFDESKKINFYRDSYTPVPIGIADKPDPSI